MKELLVAVEDLGVAAYLSLNGYKVIGKKAKQLMFEVNREGLDDLHRLKFDYLSSQYHDFDAKLMSLKKIGDYTRLAVFWQSKELVREIDDLGASAYLNMNGFKVIGKKGKVVFFEVSEQDDGEFERMKYDYLSSPYHDFDAKLMSLKKLGDYMPKDRT